MRRKKLEVYIKNSLGNLEKFNNKFNSYFNTLINKSTKLINKLLYRKTQILVNHEFFHVENYKRTKNKKKY